MKNLKTFQAVLANNLTLVAAAGMAIGTITLCCGFYCEEGCTPSITITDPNDNNAVCSGTVFERVLTTCDDWDDLVQVFNSLVSPPTTLEWWNIQEGTLFWEDWDGGNYAAHLANGINKLTATTAGCGKTSSEVDVPSNGGSGLFEQTSVTKDCSICGADVNFDFCCLIQGNIYYWIENIKTGSCHGSPCAAKHPYMSWQQDQGLLCCTVVDSAQAEYCAGSIENDVDCTCTQHWRIVDFTTGSYRESDTTRHYLEYKSSQTLSITVDGITVNCP